KYGIAQSGRTIRIDLMQREMAFLFKFGIDMQTGQPGHQPVLLEEVLKYLSPKPGGMYIDGTVGGGGHTEAILARSAPDGKVLGIDTDAQALERVGKRLASMVNNGRLTLVQGNFAELASIVQNEADFVSSIHGEENRSRQIAWRIVRARARGPITRTGQLAQLAATGVSYKPSMIHPATRVFQALRIAVNGELERLEAALPQMLDVLSAATIQK